jgi:hypothetical protein
MWSVYTMEYYSAFFKKENSVIYNNVDELGRHGVKWKNPGTESQILHDLIYKVGLKKREKIEWWLSGTRRWGYLKILAKEYKISVRWEK